VFFKVCPAFVHLSFWQKWKLPLKIIVKVEWFQATAVKWLRTALFWVTTQKGAVLSSDICWHLLHWVTGLFAAVYLSGKINPMSEEHTFVIWKCSMFWTLMKPDNTQHMKTDIHASGRFWTYNPSKRAAADPRLRSSGHWDRQWNA
jgi:hypothetical protein